MKTLTIIGASGFLGRSTLDYAKKYGLKKWNIRKIVAISRKKISEKSNRKIKLKLVKSDIRKMKILFETDYIIYAVNSYNFRKDLIAINNFQRLLSNLKKKPKILFTSSGAVYGKLKGKDEYIRSKLMIEKKMKKLGSQGFKVSIASLYTFLGKRILKEKKYAISDFINSAKYKNKIILKSKIKIVRS